LVIYKKSWVFFNLLEVDDLSHVSHLVTDSLKGNLYQ
jgi:hypothetical protein